MSNASFVKLNGVGSAIKKNGLIATIKITTHIKKMEDGKIEVELPPVEAKPKEELPPCCQKEQSDKYRRKEKPQFIAPVSFFREMDSFIEQQEKEQKIKRIVNTWDAGFWGGLLCAALYNLQYIFLY